MKRKKPKKSELFSKIPSTAADSLVPQEVLLIRSDGAIIIPPGTKVSDLLQGLLQGMARKP